MVDGKLSKKTAIVTGAARGILEDKKMKIFKTNGDFVKEVYIDTGICLDMEYIEGKIFILHQDIGDYTKRNLTIFDMDKNQGETLEFDNVLAFSRYDNGKILLGLVEDAGSHLFIYDYNKKRKIAQDIPYISASDFTYDVKEDAIYYITNNSIKKVQLKNNVTETVLINESANFGKIKMIRNDCTVLAVFDENSNTIYITEQNNEINSDENNKSITVFSNNTNMELEPRIKKTIGIRYYQALKTNLMSGTKDFDIFVLNNDDSYYYLKNKTMEDLSIYHDISVKFEDMFYGIEKNCSHGNILFGVPLSMNIQAWNVNETLLQQLNLICPEGTWTWDKFYDFAKSAKQYSNEEGIPDVYAIVLERKFPPFYFQYCSVLDKEIQTEFPETGAAL